MILKPRLFRKPRKGHWATKGLVGLWLFNEGSGEKVFDLSGNGNTGTFAGTNPSWTSGTFGSAFQATGGGSDDRIAITASDSLKPTTAITVVAGFKLTASGSSFGMMLSGGGSNSYELRFNSTNDQPEFFVNDARARDTSALSVDVPHVIIGTYDSVNIKIYTDGRLIAQTAETNPIGAASAITIGTRGTSFDLSADFDFVYIYNRALSASETTEITQEPFVMFERDDIELWVGATSVGAPPAANPKGPLGHPLCGALAGPISF